MMFSDGEVSDTDLRLWVASDKEKAEVGIAVNCLLTNLNHLGNGIKTPYDEKYKITRSLGAPPGPDF